MKILPSQQQRGDVGGRVKKKYQYQFQLRRNSIISVEEILARFRLPATTGLHIHFVAMEKAMGTSGLLTPSLSIGDSIGILRRATGRFKSTRPDLRVADYT